MGILKKLKKQITNKTINGSEKKQWGETFLDKTEL